jgi:hypothetical protein
MKTKKMNFIVCFAIFMLAIPVISAQTYVAEFRDNPKLWGYISSDGKIIIPCKFASVSPFSPEGIAVVKEPESKIEKYIDINGNELKLEVDAQNRKEFKEGMAPVKINEKWGYVNTSGKLVIPAEYKKVNYFCNGRAWVTNFAGIISLLDKQGNTIDLSKLGIIDYQNFSEGLAAVKIGTTWGFIDVNGNLVIENKYLKVDYFSDGLTWAKLGEVQIGYMNKKGEMVISSDFLSCDRFDPVSGMARVKSPSGWHYIDKSGKTLEVNTKKYNDFQEGLCRADNNDPELLKVGFIKKDGTWAIQPEFDAASDFQNGLSCVRVNKLWGLIDKNGKHIIEPIYNNLEDFYPVK